MMQAESCWRLHDQSAKKPLIAGEIRVVAAVKGSSTATGRPDSTSGS
jgi:hypothetical protein